MGLETGLAIRRGRNHRYRIEMQTETATSPAQKCCYMALRAGSGVVFNNASTGNNLVSDADIDLYEEDTGTWPLAYQVGSGINGYTDGHNSCAGGTLNNSPTYLWNNTDPQTTGGVMTTDSQTPTIVELNRDYFVSGTQPGSLLRQQQTGDTCSTKYNYAPYTYPYPWE